MAPEASARAWRRSEEQAWRDLGPEEYDRALSALLAEAATLPGPAAREALLALASATLRRKSSTLTESRARCAEHLLALDSASAEPALRARIRLLVLLAWLHLAVVAARGPASIKSAPDLPRGAGLPFGADAQAVRDPALREQAREVERKHAEQVERWNAGQTALEHLHELARRVHAGRAGGGDGGDVWRELVAAMALAPGLPAELRRSLEEDAEHA